MGLRRESIAIIKSDLSSIYIMENQPEVRPASKFQFSLASSKRPEIKAARTESEAGSIQRPTL